MSADDLRQTLREYAAQGVKAAIVHPSAMADLAALLLEDEGFKLDPVDEEDEGWAMPPFDSKTGKLRIMAEKCSTCIMRPGNRMNLEEGRVAQMLAEVRATDTYTTCHKTLGTGHPGALCRGISDAHMGQLERVYRRLGDWVVEVTEDDVLTQA